MLNKLDGYGVMEAELQEYIAGLTVPAFDVEVIKKENIYEVYCNGTLLYYSEIEIKADEEHERLEDCCCWSKHRSILRIKKSYR